MGGAMGQVRTDWVLVGLLWAVGLFAAAQFGKISLALPQVAAAYERSETSVALVVSMVGFVGIALGAVVGGLIARLGASQMMLGALALGVVLSAVQAFGLSYGWLLAVRGIEGLSHLILVVAAPTLMVQVAATKDHSVVMGLWGTFFGVSFAASALILPGILRAGGLPLVFGLHGAGLLVLGVILLFRLPRTSGVHIRQNWLAEHRLIYTTPRIFAPALGFFWHTLMFVALLTYLPPVLGAAPWIAAALPIVSLAGTFAAGWLARYVAPDQIAIAAFLGTSLFMAAGASVLWIALPTFFLIGLVPGASFAAIPYFNTESTAVARANGAMAQLGNVGTTAGTPLFAWGLAQVGPAGLSGLTVVLSLAGAAALWAIRQKIGQDAD